MISILFFGLGNFDFDQAALNEILQSLCKDRHESPFYSGLLESKADTFHQLWQQQHNAAIEIHQRDRRYLDTLQLEDRIRELREENKMLLKQISYGNR